MRLPFVLLLLLAASGGAFWVLRPGSEPAVNPEGSYLSEAKRLELFDIERADRLLGLSLKPWLQGMKEGDEDATFEADYDVRAVARELSASIPGFAGIDLDSVGELGLPLVASDPSGPDGESA